jgi:hypothetical protein
MVVTPVDKAGSVPWVGGRTAMFRKDLTNRANSVTVEHFDETDSGCGGQVIEFTHMMRHYPSVGV